MKKLDILFINPCANLNTERLRKEKMKTVEKIARQDPPHMGMGYLLAVADSHGIHADYVDMGAEDMTVDELLKIISETNPDIIGMTAFTVQVKSASYVAEQIKNKFPHIKICLGGPHATAIPFDTLVEFPAFDFVVASESDNILQDIINNKDNPINVPGIVTRDTKKFVGNRILNLDSLPFPAWNRFNLAKYPGQIHIGLDWNCPWQQAEDVRTHATSALGCSVNAEYLDLLTLL